MKKQLLLALAFISIIDLKAQMYGIDVSAVQGTITWSQVSAAGKTFAYAKATKGTCYVDPNFTTNMTGGTSAGLVMGAYHFALPEDNTASAEATYFLNTASSYIGNCHLPPALDIEDPAGTCIVNSSPLSSYFTYSQLAQWIGTWVNQVHNSTGIWPVVYIARCYAASIYPYYGSTIPSQCQLWIADWSDPAGSPANTSGCIWNSWPWVFDQYSSTGTVSGISGAVDLDYYGGSLSSLKTLAGCSSSSCTGWAVSPTSGSYTSAGGTGSFSVTTAVGGCSYSATSGSSWITNVTSSGGTVSYSVSANNTCSSQTGYIYVYDATSTLQATYTVTESGIPVPNPVTVSGGGTFCGSTTLTASGGSGGTIYWQGTNSNGTSTATPSTSQFVSSSGTYYFRSYNSCGWGAQGSATVTISSVPGSVSVSGGGTFCNSTTVTASGGSGGTIYWQGTNNGGTSTSTPSSSQVVTSSGTYYFNAYNSCGWGTQGSATVTINTGPAAVTVTGGGVYCGNATLTATGGSGGTIYWEGTTSGGTSTATPSSSQVVNTSGTYYFRSYNNNCGWGTEESATVTINSLPSNLTFSPVSGCSPVTVTANCSNCNGCSYQWSTGSTSDTSVYASSTNYTVTATNNNNCSVSGSGSLSINGQPTVSIISSNPGFCPGGTVTLSTSPTAASYSWSGPNGYTSNAAQITIGTAGGYSVTVTNPGSCSGTATSSTNIIQYNPPTVNAGTNQTNSGSGVVIGGSPTASGGQPPYSYVWTPGSTLDNSTIANPTANPTSTTTYTVIVTDNNNCSASSSVSISVGGNCSYTLSSSNVNVPSSAGYDSVMLTTSSGCAWTITGGCNWAPFNPTSGSGSSLLLFTYQQNPLPSMRTCFVNIQGNIFTITQAPDTTTGIESISTIKNISILPNPNSGRFTIKIEGESNKKIRLNVFNAVGQLLTQRDIITYATTQEDFDLSMNAKGIYYVQILTNDTYYYLKVSVE